MKGRKIVLGDNTELMDCECGYYDGVLWCYLKNIELSDAFMLFSDSNKTKHIDFYYGEMQDSYDGFTSLRGINVNTDNEITIKLLREVSNSASAAT